MPAQPPAEAPDATAASGDTAKLDACDGTSCRWLTLTNPRPAEMVNVKCAACGIRAWRG